jgi:uncharacterized Zn-binding protein involved in type VI secretion
MFINGKPAAVQGSIVTGSSGVFINGKPMAALGDATSGCAGKWSPLRAAQTAEMTASCFPVRLRSRIRLRASGQRGAS